MSAYIATARIERASPRLLIGISADRDADAGAPVAAQPDDPIVDLTAADAGDPLAQRIAAAKERWSQLTFYLFDAEGWR
jgi:hypothetical protein